MEKLADALASLEKAFARFEEVSNKRINNLSVLAEQKRNAKAKEAAQKKLRAEYIEALSKRVEELWEIVMKKYGSTH